MRPARVTGATERMDSPVLPEPVLRASLGHIAAVNSWLGGRRALLHHLAALWPDSPEPVTILDVGTGNGEIPRTIARWARRNRRLVHIVACDVHVQTLAIARERCAGDPDISVAPGNALELDHADNAFDIALLTLTLHHFEGDDQARALRELFRVARAIVVSELERSWPNYLGARLLAATVWRNNEITRHDGPLSVLRAFSPRELHDLAVAAGITGAKVFRHPFQRLVLRAERAASREGETRA
ncbi:MAG TPA: methyltransferase domain-containing protein [Longimicrobiales bacterium]|nr:methyltransferase domain-containing protein [Longimicrobiales bacterium]